MRLVKKIPFFILILFFLFSQVSIASSVEWYTYEEGMALAKEQNKPVMIDFHADWCGFCKKLDSETYSDSNVIEMSENFVNIKVDTEKQGQLAQDYGVRGLPTIVFTDPQGNEIRRVVGYRDAGPFLNEMEAARDGVTGSIDTNAQSPGFSIISSLMIILFVTTLLRNRKRK